MVNLTQGRQMSHPSWLTSVGLNPFLWQGSLSTCSGEVQGRFGYYYLGGGAVRAGMTPQQPHGSLVALQYFVCGFWPGCAQWVLEPSTIRMCHSGMWFSCPDQLLRSHHHPLRESWFTTTTLVLVMCITCGDSGQRIHHPTLRFIPSSLIPIRTNFISSVILNQAYFPNFPV